jgi:hypothetical protein
MTRFRIVPDKSAIDLEGHTSVHPLHGKARSLTGMIDVEIGPNGLPDLSRPYAAELSMPATGITWGGPVYDRETHRRLDVRTYPTITASVEEAFLVEENGQCGVRIKLTLHGQTRVIEGQAAVHVESGRMTIEGERVLDIREFGLDPPRLLMLKVEPLVTVHARIVAAAETGSATVNAAG